MNLDFESNYRDKILYMSFKEPVYINSKADVLKWRALWTDALKSWHSPYKALIDLSNVEKVEDSEEVRDALSNMIRFFKGFFLRKAAGYGKEFGGLLPFDSFSSEEEASKSIGIRERKAVKPGDFRSAIQFENHFQQHVIELSFTDEVEITTSEQVITLKDKLTNNLMQWHSGWNLLVDCSSVKKIDESLQKDFDRIFKFFSGFFMKQVIGYAPSSAGNWHPFKVYRSRHKAAAALESEGFTSGSDANCSTREQ